MSQQQNPQSSPQERYALLSAVNAVLAHKGLPSLTNAAAAALKATVKLDSLYAALDAPINHQAATQWLSDKIHAALVHEDDLPQLRSPAPPPPSQHGAPRGRDLGIRPQEGRTPPAGYVPPADGSNPAASGGRNPAADPSRNPAASSNRGSRHERPVANINEARAARESAREERGERRAFDSHTVFGKSACVNVECCRRSADDPTLTVNLRAANAKDGQDCKKGVAWDAAINIRLEPSEIALVLATLLGQTASFRAAGHGQANDKWFQLSETSGRYAGAIRINVNQAGRSVGANVTHTDFMQFVGVFERAAIDALKTRPIATEVKLRRMGQLYAAALEARQGGNSGAG